jgi:DNA polymerase-3 subunit gamma/tau
MASLGESAPLRAAALNRAVERPSPADPETAADLGAAGAQEASRGQTGLVSPTRGEGNSEEPASGLEPSIPVPGGEEAMLDLAEIRRVWPELIKKVGFGLGLHLTQVEPAGIGGPHVLVIAAKPGYNPVADDCGTPDALSRIEQALQRLIHRPVNVKYERAREFDELTPEGRPSDARRTDAVTGDPMVQKVVELFEARSLQLEFDDPESDS